MQEIATLKSILYGLIITFIFMVSSCEFDFTHNTATTSQTETVAINQ